jgi:hypothetical protein
MDVLVRRLRQKSVPQGCGLSTWTLCIRFSSLEQEMQGLKANMQENTFRLQPEELDLQSQKPTGCAQRKTARAELRVGRVGS